MAVEAFYLLRNGHDQIMEITGSFQEGHHHFRKLTA